ncbi:MAG: hypothetical protein CVV02_02130 [Firmicutes bacterium HGW-Firmicutes-7]|nr:MAG: hypothetical protein CVV02_02130 [Firmicutes bacterium HGW-Firmicutes-7]
MSFGIIPNILSKVGEEIVHDEKGKKDYKVEKYENTTVLSTEVVDGTKVEKLQTDYVSRYVIYDDESDSPIGLNKSSGLMLASLNQVAVAVAGSQSKGEYDDSYGVYMSSTIKYDKKSVNGSYAYKLTSSSSGKFQVIDPEIFSITNREVVAANKDMNNDVLWVKKTPTANTFNYSYSFTNYVSTVPSAHGFCGINQSVKIKRGTSTWIFSLHNEIVIGSMWPSPF